VVSFSAAQRFPVALAVAAGIEFLVGFGLVFRMRWAWWATQVLVPANLVASVVIEIVAPDAAMAVPILGYAAATALLFAPVPRLREVQQHVRGWAATRWAKPAGPTVTAVAEAPADDHRKAA